MEPSEADDWEYEYSTTETQDFYVTLDLSNVPHAFNAQDSSSENPGQAFSRPNTTPFPTRIRGLQNRLRPFEGGEEDAEDELENAADGAASVGEMQITGLHTRNPLMMREGKLLSCQWTETIGTDLLFVKPADGEEGSADLSTPVRTLPGVDLLALGTAKLIAREAHVRPRDDIIEKMPMPTEALVRPVAADRQEPASAEQEPVAPNSFLARLNQAKAKRGETTRFAVTRDVNGNGKTVTMRKVADAGPPAQDQTSTGTAEDVTMEDAHG